MQISEFQTITSITEYKNYLLNSLVLKLKVTHIHNQRNKLEDLELEQKANAIVQNKVHWLQIQSINDVRITSFLLVMKKRTYSLESLELEIIRFDLKFHPIT